MQFNSDCFHKSQTFFFFDWWKEKIDKKLVFKKNLSIFFFLKNLIDLNQK